MSCTEDLRMTRGKVIDKELSHYVTTEEKVLERRRNAN